jgi:DNA-binding response OmpR family regulator
MATGCDSVLIVTADDVFGRALGRHLGESNCATTIVRDVGAALDSARRTSPLLVLVDRRQPALSHLIRDEALRGIAVVAVQPPGADCPEEVCVDELDEGAAASLCHKGYRELIARIRAILRRERFRTAKRAQYQVGDLYLDEERHEVQVSGRPVELTPKEFAILRAFMRNPARVFTRDELVNEVWGESVALEHHTLDVHIHSIRQKIEANPPKPARLVTLRGVGYKLRAD